MDKKIIKDIAIRALKTFVQAFLSAVSVDAFLGVTDFDAFRKVAFSVLIAGAAAGICAVWNGALNYINAKNGEVSD